MKFSKYFIMMIILTATFAMTSGALFAADPLKITPKSPESELIKIKPLSKCCIAGKYEGISVDDPRCPAGPKTGKFIMILKQIDCRSEVEGEIIDPSTGAVTSKFNGTVTPSLTNCCMLVGTVKGVPGGEDENCVHNVKATLCKDRAGKWSTSDGVYNAISGSCCSGTFKMTQQ